MARLVKPQEKYHHARMRNDSSTGEILLIGRGRNAYLWAGTDNGYGITIYSGRITLRKFAKAILEAVGDDDGR